MSKIGEVLIDIEERIVRGENVQDIAKELNVPLHWVQHTENEMFYTARGVGHNNNEEQP